MQTPPISSGSVISFSVASPAAPKKSAIETIVTPSVTT